MAIIESQDGPEPDFQELNDHDPNITRIYSPLSLAFSTSFFVGFNGLLLHRTFTRYAWLDMCGPVVDRSRRQQARMDSHVVRYLYFNLVMDISSLLLPPCYLLLGYALSNYLLLIGSTFAGVVAGNTTFLCLLFYLLITSVATVPDSRPFQTPLSLLLSLIRFCSNPKKYPERTGKWFGSIFSQVKNRPRQISGGPGGFTVLNEENVGDRPIQSVADQPFPPLDKELNWDLHVSDSKSVDWMFGRVFSMDRGALLVLLRFILEVVWHAGIQTTPVEDVFQSLLGSFDFSSSGRPVVIPKLRDQAYLNATALLHLAIQRKCIGDGSDTAVFNSISSRLPVVGSEHYEGDPDLEATLNMIDCVFRNPKPMRWQNFALTIPHHTWMAHILLYRAWDTLRKGEPLPDNIEDFALRSLRLEPPRLKITADCLLIVCLVLGITFPTDGLSIVDKRNEINHQIKRIYGKLTETFRKPTSTLEEINHAVIIIELITPLAGNGTAEKSYELFRAVMRAPVSPTFSQERKWHVSRLVMRSAYKWDIRLPRVEDPHDVLTFLIYHFQSAGSGDRDQDEPIQNALNALAYASSPITVDALKCFEPTQSFVRGICYAFHDDKPLQLRKAALFFLPLIDNWLFNAPDSVMRDNQVSRLYVGWASTVDSIERTHDAQKAILAVFYGMILSPRWRPHIVPEKWKLLEYFGSVPEDSQFFRKCVDDPGFIDVIRGTEYKSPTAIVFWLAILWLRYKELTARVRERLEEVTKERARGKRMDPRWYLSVMDSELRMTEDELTRHCMQSVAAIALREKIHNLQQARFPSSLSREAGLELDLLSDVLTAHPFLSSKFPRPWILSW